MDKKDVDALTGKLKSATPRVNQIQGIDTVRSDYVHLIEYLKKSEAKQKTRNTITFIIVALTFLCSAISAVDIIVRFFQ